MGKKFYNEADIQDIADAIRTKGGSGTFKVSEMADAIENLPSGGEVVAKDVNFYDYDGTLLHSYTASEFAGLASMPENPSHAGLTAQGWNWDLVDAKTYVANHGMLVIGQMYITDDGATRIYIKVEEQRKSPYLYLGVKGTVIIDWGDGTPTDTASNTTLTNKTIIGHEYSSAGDYVISITPTEGSTLAFPSGNSRSYLLEDLGSYPTSTSYSYLAYIQKIEIGSNFEISDSFSYVLSNLISLETITIPSFAGKSAKFGNSFFASCYNLNAVVIPKGITTLPNNIFENCFALKIASIPQGLTTVGANVFQYNYNLKEVSIPDTVTSIGNQILNNCKALRKASLSNELTAISQRCFGDCSNLESVSLPTALQTINDYAFSSCYSLIELAIPQSVTSIGSYAFSGLFSMTKISFPEGIQKLTNTCNNSRGLQKVVIPSTVTQFAGYTFNGCYGIKELHMKPTTPPTLASTQCLMGFPTDAVIFVPQGCLEAYQTATNWDLYAAQMQEESA